jgi:hypothetical protein
MMAGYSLRLSDDLRARLKAAAAEDRRSVNAEIIIALEGHLSRRRVRRLIDEARSLTDRERELLDDWDATCETLRGA